MVPVCVAPSSIGSRSTVLKLLISMINTLGLPTFFFTHSAADLQWPVLAVSSARPEDFDLLLQLATLHALYVCIQDFVYIHVCNTGSYISSLHKSAAVTTLQLTAVTMHTHKHLPMSTHTCLHANKHSYIFLCMHSSTPHAVGYIVSYLHMVQPGVSACCADAKWRDCLLFHYLIHL